MAASNAGVSLGTKDRGMLYEGATISQMEVLFKMDSRTINARIQGIAPCGVRGNAKIYPIHLVVKRLWAPSVEQLMKAIPNMNPQAMPPELHKEFWNALRAKQAFEEAEGDLWRTTQVIDAFSTLVKMFKHRVQLRVDSVARQVELSPAIIKLLKDQDNALLREMQTAITDVFSQKHIDKANEAPNAEEDDDGEL